MGEMAGPLTIQGDEDGAEAIFEIAEYVHGAGARELLSVHAGTELDWGGATFTLDQAVRLRDWLNQHPALPSTAVHVADADTPERDIRPGCP